MEENNKNQQEHPQEDSQIKKEKFDFEKFYNKNYKLILVIPIILLIASLFYLSSFQATNGDIIYKDISLSGGTSIQVNTETNINELKSILEENFEDISIRSISDVLTGKQLALVIETTAPLEEIQPFIENQLGFTLDEQNSSIEFTGSSLSDSFYNQLRFALILSFILMAIIVFIIFRTFIPSIAVVFAALGNIVMTLAVVNLLGMKLSTAGIVAFLMLIGYSVDTDILLTTRVIKRKEGSVNSRILSALKTGMTMTLTSLLVVLIGYFLTAGFSKVFSQIFTILTIGLIFDLINTWLFNASIIKWYAQK
jgi:preprotein translocase subunit SecF